MDFESDAGRIYQLVRATAGHQTDHAGAWVHARTLAVHIVPPAHVFVYADGSCLRIGNEGWGNVAVCSLHEALAQTGHLDRRHVLWLLSSPYPAVRLTALTLVEFLPEAP